MVVLDSTQSVNVVGQFNGMNHKVLNIGKG